MSKIINIHDAKTHLSKYLERATRGEEVRIGKYGKPMARLVPDTAAKKPRQLGGLKGKIRMASDFDEPMMELWSPKD